MRKMINAVYWIRLWWAKMNVCVTWMFQNSLAGLYQRPPEVNVLLLQWWLWCPKEAYRPWPTATSCTCTLEINLQRHVASDTQGWPELPCCFQWQAVCHLIPTTNWTPCRSERHLHTPYQRKENWAWKSSTNAPQFKALRGDKGTELFPHWTKMRRGQQKKIPYFGGETGWQEQRASLLVSQSTAQSCSLMRSKAAVRSGWRCVAEHSLSESGFHSSISSTKSKFYSKHGLHNSRPLGVLLECKAM